MKKVSTSIPVSSATHHLVAKKNSEKLLIIFSATGTKPSKFNMWKLRDFIPHNLLYVRVPTNNWYQNGIPGIADNHVDTIEAIKNFVSELGIKEVFTCGSSMGAYGALLYGSILNCNVLAFSPETQLKLPHSRSTKMMPKDAMVSFPNLKPMMKKSNAIFHIYTGEKDPVDLYCADRVKDLQNVNIVTFPADEHTVFRTLVFSDRFLPLLWSFMAGSNLPKLEGTGRALENKGFAENLYKGWVAFQKKENQKSELLLQAALDIYPISSIGHFTMTSLMYRLKNYEKGKNHALFALTLDPDNPRNHNNIAHYFRRIGLLNEAIEMHLKIQKRWPESYYSKIDLAMIYEALGRKTQAKILIKEAITLQPKNQSFRKILVRLETT